MRRLLTKRWQLVYVRTDKLMCIVRGKELRPDPRWAFNPNGESLDSMNSEAARN
jgi:hypothetical protein